MNYYIGQALGLAATVCTIILPFFKKKWQILILNICVNLFIALNFVLIGQIGSAAFLCTVAIFQSIDSMVHDVKGTPITLVEKVLFLCLYLGFGFFAAVGFPPAFCFATVLELTPIAGTALMMAAIYAPNEQATRRLLLFNGILWTLYALTKGSSTFLTNATSASAAGIALWRYRHQHKE